MKEIDDHPEDKVESGQRKEVKRLVKTPHESWFPDSLCYSLPHPLLLPLGLFSVIQVSLNSVLLMGAQGLYSLNNFNMQTLLLNLT